MNEIYEKLKTEWEIAVCAAVLFLLLLFLLKSLFGYGSRHHMIPRGQELNAPRSRINVKTAYALLQPDKADTVAVTAFKPRFTVLEAKPEVPIPRPRPRPEPRPRPQPQPQPKPEPEPAEPPPPKVIEVPPPVPAGPVLVYRGYRTGPDGIRYALVQDLSSGQGYRISQGRSLYDFMVSRFTETELILLNPAGRELRLSLDQEFPLKP